MQLSNTGARWCDAGLSACCVKRQSKIEEGVWKRRLHSRIAQRVIELEEYGLDLTGVVGIDGQKSPEERIYYADLRQERYESGEKWDFANFFSLPLGLGAGWNVKKEYVDC